MNTKILSIIIPTYNSEKFILDAIDSIPYREDIEIIVIDDASEDFTFDIIREIEDITIIKVSKWQPTGYCRNLGLKAASGEFIFGLDSDDKLDTNKFNKFIDFVYNNKDKDVINIRLLDNNGKIYDGRKKGSTCTKVSKLETIRKYNVKFPNILIAEDKGFGYSLRSHCKKIGYYSDIFYYYNHPREGSSMGNNSHKNKR